MEYYKKIFIKSADDLPKEEGYYFVETKANTDRKMDLFYWRFTNFAQGKECWLHDIDWYLMPVEFDLPTEEEIENQFPYARSYGNYCRQEGANWLLSEIKKRNNI